jgi:hypothetical protein
MSVQFREPRVRCLLPDSAAGSHETACENEAYLPRLGLGKRMPKGNGESARVFGSRPNQLPIVAFFLIDGEVSRLLDDTKVGIFVGYG